MGRYVSVPLTRFSQRRDEILLQLGRLGAGRVFLCTDRGFHTKDERAQTLDALKDAVRFFRSEGYSVGIWLSSLGHGGELSGVSETVAADGFTNLVGVDGSSAEDSFCPLDEGFQHSYCSWIAALAGVGADMIMLDDDFRLGNRPGGFGCFCEKHMAQLRSFLGEELTREQLFEMIYCGGRNGYRDAYLDTAGETLRSFAKKLRVAVDSVNPCVRLGACACLSVWDGDGIDSIEISKLLAGKTAPFMRLIGAAYWAAQPVGFGGFANRLGYIVELERMQAHWCENLGIEIMTEGDVYPRPRYNVPAAYLEGFDTALLADGRADGILKYAIDYTSSPLYETGYALSAQRNNPLYAWIEEHFSGKNDVGIRVVCTMKKLRDKLFPETTGNIAAYAENSFCQPEQAFLCDNSLPAAYGSGKVCVCFGENAKYIDIEGLDGLILDLPAALLLRQRGTDTGVVSAQALSGAKNEYFPSEDEVTALSGCSGLYAAELCAGANALSFFDPHSSTPAAYTYENADGLRFYVLCADMDSARGNSGFRRSYARQRQAIGAIRYLSESATALPAVCTGNPDLYILCKAGGGSLCVGLWNFFADRIVDPVIKLSDTYSSISFFGCSGTLSGNTVRLSGDIPAYGCAFFEVTR